MTTEPVPKTSRTPLIAGGCLVALVVGCCCPLSAIVGYIGWPSVAARSAATDFVDAVRDDRNGDAFPLMSDAYRASHTALRFGTGVRHCGGLFEADTYSLSTRTDIHDLDRMNIDVRTTSSSPSYRLVLVADDGGWHVDEVRSSSVRDGCSISSARR